MTEIGRAEAADIATIIKKITTAVQQATTPEIYRRLTMTFKVFPEEVTGTSGEGADELLFPDVSTRLGRRRYEVLLKRSMDIAGSLFAIMMFLPAALIIAALVKFTSEGPVLFSQKRMGQYGREFNFLKFRTMYINNDPAVHREYVKKLIAGEGGVGQPNGMYKLANDKRITPLGRILRKTSLDELPQMINVLRNDMSLVGPRPPLPYEYERYRTWHKRRVRELKPGITGLWQVGGRSRINFEDMVRLDLRYANIRSIRLDIVILLRTPWAMISGRGAC
jgi:lipopolysaccharide/colanic/teichoic acid biosynthesis glycosyltransferase